MARALIGPRERAQFKVKLGFYAFGTAVALLLLLALLPFAWMVLTSLRPASDLFQFPARWVPSRWTLQAYTEVLERLPLADYFINSLLVSLATVFGQLLFCTPAAYALARLKPGAARLWTLLFAATLMVPMEAMVVPLYLQLRAFPLGFNGGINLLDTLPALVLPGLVSAFNIFVLRGFFARLPQEIMDSAKLDGCTEVEIFWRFALPLSRPILTVLGIFGFIAAWNAFFWPLVATSDPARYTLMLGLQKMLETGEPWNVVMAGVTLAALPSLLVFLLFQRWISRGLAFSGHYQ